jgi:RNA polymerase sigma-70 factor, ECF subfamily
MTSASVDSRGLSRGIGVKHRIICLRTEDDLQLLAGSDNVGLVVRKLERRHCRGDDLRRTARSYAIRYRHAFFVTKTAIPSQCVGVSESDRPAGSGLEAFDEIYERELDYVWRTLGRFGVPSADIQDAAHEVFLVLYRRWNEVDPQRPVHKWLFGVARRVAADFRAKRRENPTQIELATPEDPLAAKRDLLRSAMDALDDDRRAVVILHDLEGHTGAEIAALLDIPANTVHSRLRLARADLVAAVQKLGGLR